MGSCTARSQSLKLKTSYSKRAWQSCHLVHRWRHLTYWEDQPEAITVRASRLRLSRSLESNIDHLPPNTPRSRPFARVQLQIGVSLGTTQVRRVSASKRARWLPTRVRRSRIQLRRPPPRESTRSEKQNHRVLSASRFSRRPRESGGRGGVQKHTMNKNRKAAGAGCSTPMGPPRSFSERQGVAGGHDQATDR